METIREYFRCGGYYQKTMFDMVFCMSIEVLVCVGGGLTTLPFCVLPICHSSTGSYKMRICGSFSIVA